MTRALVDQIVMPIVVGLLMLAVVTLIVWITTGATPAMFEMADWPTTAQVISTLWIVMVSFVVGFGPWLVARRFIRETRAKA